MVILEGDADKKYLFSRSGEKIAGPFFHFRPFKEGLARVRKDAGYYFIDTEGKEIIGPLDKSWYIGDFEGGLVSVSVGPIFFFLDKNGERVDKKVETKVTLPPSTETPPNEWPKVEQKQFGRKYLINENGEEIAGPFNRVDKFREGLALVNIEKEGGHYGENYFVNKEGKIVLGPYYGKYGRGFEEGVAVVVDNSGKFHYIDHKGNNVFE